MSRTTSSQSFEAQTSIMDQKSLVKFPDQGELSALSPYPHGATSLHADADNVRVPPTLETLPQELQLHICRAMLRSQELITLSPCEPYICGFAFGSLGISRVSKHFSTMALGVMYGENCFCFKDMQYTIEDGYFEDEDEDLLTVSFPPC